MKRIFLLLVILTFGMVQNAAASASCGLVDPVLVAGDNGGNPQYYQIFLRGKVWHHSTSEYVDSLVQVCLGDACTAPVVSVQSAIAISAQMSDKMIWFYLQDINSCEELKKTNPMIAAIQQMEIRAKP